MIPPQIYEPEKIDDPVKWLKYSLRLVARPDPVESTETLTDEQRQLSYIEHSLLPAMRVVEIFLHEIGVKQSAIEPISYVLEAFRRVAEGRSHELFHIKIGRRKQPDPTELWLARLPIVSLAAALRTVDKKTPLFGRLSEELKPEIIALKSKGGRKGAGSGPKRIIKGWMDALEGNRTTRGEQTWEQMKGLRVIYAAQRDSDIEEYEQLLGPARLRWFQKKVATLRKDMRWYLNQGG